MKKPDSRPGQGSPEDRHEEILRRGSGRAGGRGGRPRIQLLARRGAAARADEAAPGGRGAAQGRIPRRPGARARPASGRERPPGHHGRVPRTQPRRQPDGAARRDAPGRRVLLRGSRHPVQERIRRAGRRAPRQVRHPLPPDVRLRHRARGRNPHRPRHVLRRRHPEHLPRFPESLGRRARPLEPLLVLRQPPEGGRRPGRPRPPD